MPVGATSIMCNVERTSVVDRRQFITTALGLSAIAFSGLPAPAATMTYDDAVRTSRAPLQAAPRDRELVRFATLAANSHNTQPRKFNAHGNESVFVFFFLWCF